MKLRLDGLRLQLLGLVILPFVLLLLALSLLGVSLHQQAMRRLVAERDERAARAAASAIASQLHHQGASVRDVAISLEGGASPQGVLGKFDHLAQDFDHGLAVMTPSGEILAASDGEEAWAERRRALPPFDQIGEEPSFSGFSEDDGTITVLVRSKEKSAIVLGAFSVDSVVRSVLTELTGPDVLKTAFVISSSGQLIYAVGSPPAADELAQHPGVQASLRGEIGSSYFPGADGEHVVAFSPIPPTGWSLLIEEPWKQVASPTLDATLAAPLALVPALLVTLVALWFGARQVVEPLRRLERQSREIDLGDDDPLEDEPVGGIAEIKQLQATLVSMSRRVRAAQRALRGYISAITRAQEEERRRVARELHDTTIQDLIALDQRIQMASMELEAKGSVDAARLNQLHRDAAEAILKVRRISRGLRPIYLDDLGLVPALEALTRDAETELGIPVAFEVVGEAARLSPQAELAVYRIVQEALNNVARHAQATRAEVELGFSPTVLNVTVADDGHGFERPKRISDLTAQGHYGLMGMRERAELVGAELEIASTPGEGTRISILVPLAS